jgi:hypothetical protein
MEPSGHGGILPYVAENDKPPTPRQAEKRVEEARAELEQAQAMQATVARGGMADLLVEVLPDNTVKDESGKHHEAGSQFAVEGLTAVGLAQAGHVKIVGTKE